MPENQDPITIQPDNLEGAPPLERIEKDCKVVLIGDEGVGKTSLSLFFKNGQIPKGELPIITPNYQKDVGIEDKNTTIHIVVWDSACGADDKEIRMRSYPDTDVFVLCMSLQNEDSCNNLLLWAKEIFKFDIKANIIICGTHADKMNIHPDIISNITRNIAHNYYIETSSVSGNGVNELFKVAAEIKANPESHPIHLTDQVPPPKHKKDSQCCLLI